jgi:ubiquinone/menaquinone biosynthesis C-methylase UbiE
MSKTANIEHWNQNSEYHSLRENDAMDQVNKLILPFIIKNSLDRKPITIADFACGGGAIVSNLCKKALLNNIFISRIVLIDVIPENLVKSKERLVNIGYKGEIETHLCNGKDFNDYMLPRIDYLYCWDAMVHFDILDVAGYISTLKNVCSNQAFIHHSNRAVLTTDITKNPHWRNFMNKDIFAQIVVSSGYKVINQNLIDWGIPELDCITTIQL